MANEFKTYPPTYVKPGDTVSLTAENGEIEFIGVYDDSVIDFLLAYYEQQRLNDGTIAPSQASKEYMQRKLDKCFNALPTHARRLVAERYHRGIWLPEKGENGA